MEGNGDVCQSLATEFMALAEKQGATIPTMIGHRLMGQALILNGYVAEARACYDKAIALYDPLEHRALTTRFGLDQGATALSYRSLALWMLGYPAVAVTDLKQALANAREFGHVGTLSSALLIGNIRGE